MSRTVQRGVSIGDRSEFERPAAPSKLARRGMPDDFELLERLLLALCPPSAAPLLPPISPFTAVPQCWPVFMHKAIFNTIGNVHISSHSNLMYTVTRSAAVYICVHAASKLTVGCRSICYVYSN